MNQAHFSSDVLPVFTRCFDCVDHDDGESISVHH